jgi:hypothetical protein
MAVIDNYNYHIDIVTGEKSKLPEAQREMLHTLQVQKSGPIQFQFQKDSQQSLQAQSSEHIQIKIKMP